MISEREGREEEREGETHQCERETSLVAFRMPSDQRSNPQPRPVPQVGIEPATF